MDNTTLKAQIDSQITNETTPASITPTDVGTNLKAIVDYVDQESRIKVVKTTITSEQVLTLFENPIIILDSSAAGVVKIPINIWIKRNAGTIYACPSDNFSITGDTGINMLTQPLYSIPLKSSSVGYTMCSFDVSNYNTTEKNNLYKLKAQNASPYNGTGSLDVYVAYVEITL